ncbi:MAG: TauD/TfdA family dioxygenase [Alphaproteobacteria bacterium]|nr:TauD/TfdA family dioxygenase [Alphaproteobacteria bacterium]
MATATQDMSIRPLSPALGAEITGIDLGGASTGLMDRIYQAFLDHSVLVVRDQELTPDQFGAFGERFGAVQPHPVTKNRHPEDARITVLGTDPGAKPDRGVLMRGVGWHTDMAYETKPAKATALYAREVPTVGGDTLFASMYAAYDALPQTLRARLDPLMGVFKYGGRTAYGTEILTEAQKAKPAVEHRVVRVHPETGRKALYVNPYHSLGFAGVAPAESNAMLDEIFAEHLVRPEWEYRHKWRPGDVVVWDNRCLVHSATGDYPLDQRRHIWRVCIMPRD